VSKCIECTECRTVYTEPNVATCRASIFLGRIPIDHPFLTVERKCVYFEEEGINDNAPGDKKSNK